MNWSALAGAFADRYERTARVGPGFLLLFPIFVLLWCAFGARKPIPTGFFSLLIAAGVGPVLAALSRGAGKRLEERLFKHWGGRPTTLVLRHRDSHYNAYTKARLHEALGRVSGISLPSAVGEFNNPTDADARYHAAADELRRKTFGHNYPHLRREVMSYGLYRNALGLKPLGLVVAAISFILGTVMGGVASASSPYFHWQQFLRPGLPAAISMGTSLVMMIIWLSLSSQGLKRAGVAYADRLFECLDQLAKPPPAAGTVQG